MRTLSTCILLLGIACLWIGCGSEGSGNSTNVTTNTSPTPGLTPPPTPSPSTSNTNANTRKSVDEVLKDLPIGSIGYNAPPTMDLEETMTIQLVLRPNKTAAEAGDMVKEPGKVETAEGIRITEEMEAHLTADPSAFKITPITLARQQIPQNEPTEWRWQVTPLKTGEQRLALVLNIIYDNHGKEQKRTLPTHETKIDVRVGIGKRVTRAITTNWDWIWKALLLPTLGALWLLIRRYLGKRGREKQKPSEAQAKAIIQEHLGSEYGTDPAAKVSFEFGEIYFGTPTQDPKDHANSGRTVYPVRVPVSILVTRSLNGEERVEKIERGRGKETFYVYKDDFNQWCLDIRDN